MSGQRREPRSQYAILRVVPRVERGECINAGVVLFCRTAEFLAARIVLDERRARGARPDVDPAAVARAPATRSCASPPATPDGRADRRAPAGGALRLARRAVEHDRAAVRGAHRALR